MSIQNSKSTLAKLLAQENISVEHRRIQTAYFDPKNRVLALPVWKNMSKDLYDLLVGHEVGHAWDTPPDGWHTEVTNHPRGFKSYLNVVEDARIEKKIKSRYPGLRSSFYAGYKELIEKDFFGLSKYNIKSLPLIDRLNLHFKVGPFMAIKFEDHEQPYVERMERLDTWDEVVAIAKELYDKRKDELESQIADLDNINVVSTDDEGDDDGDEVGDEMRGLLDELSDPDSITDTEFRNREASLVSDDAKPYRYAYLPDTHLEMCIVPFKDIQSKTDWTWFDMNTADEARLHAEYKFQNSRFIQYLVKEFELRRNASQMARASIAKTGELDINKVFSYKLKDDLFKRVTQIPGGKNHGMVMYVDWSGSMADVLKATIDQTLVLADFCRKVNIPFRVFAFTDNPEAGMLYDHNRFDLNNKKFSTNDGELSFEYSNFYALELLSSQMNMSQYNFAQRKMLMVASMYERQHGWRGHHVPPALQLNGTPLDASIVFATKYTEKFKEIHKLDVVNAIFLTDGESNLTEYIYETRRPISFNSKYGIHNYRNCNTVVTHRKTGVAGKAGPGQAITVALLDLMKNMSDVNLIGFYIIAGNRNRALKEHLHRLNVDDTNDALVNHMREHKFVQLENQGYSKYFVIKSTDIEITEDSIDIDSESAKSSRKLAKAFTDMQKKKLVNRVLLNRFVAEIS